MKFCVGGLGVALMTFFFFMPPSNISAKYVNDRCLGSEETAFTCDRQSQYKGDGAAAAGAAMAAPLFGPIFFFNQLVNKLLCWVKQ